MRIEVHRGHKTVHALLTDVGQMTIGGAYTRGIQNNGYRNKAEQLKQTDSKIVLFVYLTGKNMLTMIWNKQTTKLCLSLHLFCHLSCHFNTLLHTNDFTVMN